MRGPKSVLLCGDHVCVNKKEANQYFQENLSLEVRIINNQKNDDVDLIELNLSNNVDNKKIITLEKRIKLANQLKNFQKRKLRLLNQKLKKG